MPDNIPTQDSAIFTKSQEAIIQKNIATALNKADISRLISDELKKESKASYKNTTIIVITCILVTIAVIAFSIFYTAQLKNSIIVNVKEAVQNSNSSTSETLSGTAPSAPTDPVIKQTITVDLESANLLSADYLAVVLPIMISLAGAYIVFLGMNRLKMFDERIDNTRTSLLKELSSMVTNQVAAGQAKQTQELHTSLQHEQEIFNNSVTEAQKNLNALTDKHTQAIESAGQGFNWLKEIVTRDEFDLSINTVEEAHKLAEKLYDKKPKNYVELIRELVNRVCTNPYSGDSSDYHNFSADLARGSMYHDSVNVLKKGLTLFPDDTDLLADLISYATKGGMFQDAADAKDKLLTIDRRLWTWRCYIFINDYYRSIGDIEAANEICDSCIAALPTDEHGYREKAENARLLTPGLEGILNSIDILKFALNSNINCTQCANLLGETYLELGEYQQALAAFNRTMQELAQEQPRVNTAFVFYNRALCYDRMFMSSINNNSSELEYAFNACLDYVAAIKEGRLTPITASQANRRINILSRYLPSVSTDEE